MVYDIETDIDVILIKAVDRFHNLKTINWLKYEKQKAFIEETEIYIMALISSWLNKDIIDIELTF